MCPLRFVLIFLSAILAAFLAFTSYSESRGFTDPSPDESPEDNTTEESKKIEKNSEKVSCRGFHGSLR
jgi:Na+-transporting methylmalonyl-CoA/oxaloacetate decarboxylase gamma subunit